MIDGPKLQFEIGSISDMEIFDDLPGELRDALNYADFAWPAGMVRERLNDLGDPGLDYIPEEIETLDRAVRDKVDL